MDLLRRSIARGRVSHAYLFSGPRRIGKRTLALAFARALNCERLAAGSSPKVDPCGKCRRCRLIGAGKHPEVRVVGVQPPHRLIRVADVESIQADAALKPADVQRKVYVIEQAELLNTDAATRLLKTLEEPSGSVVFILTTTDPEATLPTIASRCQQLRLRPLSRAELAGYLVDALGLAPEQAEGLAALGEGRVGWALQAARDNRLVERRGRVLDELRGLLDADRLDRLQYARALTERWGAQPELVRETLETWLRWWRDLLLLQAGLSERIVNVDRRSELEGQARRLSSADVSAATEGTHNTLLMLDQNVNPRLALDVCLLSLPRLDRAA